MVFFSRSSFVPLGIEFRQRKVDPRDEIKSAGISTYIQTLRLECAILLKITALPVPRHNTARKKNLQSKKKKKKEQSNITQPFSSKR